MILARMLRGHVLGSGTVLVTLPLAGGSVGCRPAARESTAPQVPAITPRRYLIADRVTAPAPPRYVITDLGTLPGDTSSRGIAINDKGQVLGSFSKRNAKERYFLWEKGKKRDLAM